MTAAAQLLFQRSLVSVVFGCGNTILHGLGLYLLICLYRKGQKNVQQLLVVNLCLVECINSIFIAVQGSTNVHYYNLRYNWNATKADMHVTRAFNRSLAFIGFTSMLYLYFASMIYITVDRALAVLLHFKYKHYMTKKRVMIILFATWIFNIALTIALCILGAYYSWKTILYYKNFVIYYALSYYIPAVFDFLYLIIALISYAILFSEFVKSKRQFTNNENHESLWTIFRNSKFYVSVLLISSFLIFTIIPNLIITGLTIDNAYIPYALQLYITVSFNISYTVDGIIFIFLQEKVRKLFKEKFFGHRHHNASGLSASQTLMSTMSSSQDDRSEVKRGSS